jgi:uncharacterized protein (DUF2252 family)
MADTDTDTDTDTNETQPVEATTSADKVRHFTTAERTAHGRAARADAPRTSQGTFDTHPERDPVTIIDGESASRVPELVPIRYGRMLVSPFTFYRGAAALMAHDLAPTPRAGLKVQLCGDAHLSNFGGYASPDRALVFDLNDFDETAPGPFEWDVKRLATSFEICARDRGIDDAERKNIVLGVTRAYRNAMRDFAAMDNLSVWYSRLDADMIEERLRVENDRKQAKALQQNVAKAQTKDNLKALAKLTHVVDGEVRIISDPPLIVPIEELAGAGSYRDIEQEIHALFRGYRRSLQHDRRKLMEGFRIVHLARKVVGVGSVGTRAWILLMLGRDDSDPLFLQIKEAESSVLEPYLGKGEFKNHGQRVVEGQRMMQAASDIFLGWIRNPKGLDGKSRDFYVRQLWDWKTSANLDTILPRGLEVLASTCGWTLARAHARSGDRVAMASYLGKSDVFDRAVADFAVAYADLNERDYAAMQEAVRSGRLTAEEGV